MYKSNKYSAQKDAVIEDCAMVKHAEASDALTLDEIICGEPLLAGVSTQKLARVMMKFVDMGFVVKSKRRDGKMIYKTVAKMEEEGYERDPVTHLFGGEMA